MKEQENSQQMKTEEEKQQRTASRDLGASVGRLKSSLNRRITSALVLLMGIMAIAIIVISGNSMRRIYYSQYSAKAQDLVRFLANEVDGDWANEFVKTLDENDLEYQIMKNMLDQLKTDFTGIQYLYIYKPGEDSFVYLVD